MFRSRRFSGSLVPFLLWAAWPGTAAASPSIRFVDGEGRTAETLLYDREYQVEVADPAGDTSSSGPDYLFAPVFSSQWGMDFPVASVILQETGVASGIFRGAFRVVASANAGCHGATIACIAAPSGAQLTARDPLAPGTAEATAWAGSYAVLDLLDGEGRPLAETLENVPLRLRLIDGGQDPELLESRTVTVESLYGDDLESVVLWEESAYSGVFTGTLPSRFLGSGAVPGDGELTVAAGASSGPASGEQLAVHYAGQGGNPPADAVVPVVAARLRVLDHDQPGMAMFPADCPLRLQLDYPILAASGGPATFYLEYAGQTRAYLQYPGKDGAYALELPCDQLSLSAGDTLLVRTPLDYYHSGELQASWPIAAASLRFLDPDSGAALATAPDLRPFAVQLRDSVNDPGLVETRHFEITATMQGFPRPLELIETSAASGTFEARVEPTLQFDSNLPKLHVARRHTIADRGGVFDRIAVSGSAGGGPVAAELPLTGPAVEWVDAEGRPVDRLRFGTPARVRVEDPGLDLNPGLAESRQIGILEGPADTEYLTLTETGPDTGIFTGGLPIATGQNTGSNGVLEFHPAQIFAVLRYSMANDGWGGYLDRRIQATGVGNLYFLDAEGNPTPSPLEGDDLRLRLIDFDPARSTTLADQVVVRVRSTHWGHDDESLTLTETSGDSGVFEGSLPTALAPAAVSPSSWDDGILQLARGADLDTVLATQGGAVAQAQVAGVRLRLLDRLGREIDRIGYDQLLVVELTRLTGGDPQSAETLPWALALRQLGHPQAADFEAPDLVETGPGTNLFRAQVRVAMGWQTIGNGQLEVAHDAGFIHVRYRAAQVVAERSLAIALDPAPWTTEDRVDLAAGESVTVDLAANDFDPLGGELEVGAVSPIEGGHYTAAVVNPDGTVTVTGAAGAHGAETLLYLVGNAAGQIAEGRLNVIYETPPTLTLLAPANGSTFPAGSAVTLSATANDLDEGNLSSAISWSSSRDGALGAGASLVTGGLSLGSHTITASVADSAGGTASAALTLTIVPANTAPLVAILSPSSGGRVGAGDGVSLSGSAADAESGNLAASLAWTSSLAGSLGTGASITTSALGVGIHTITATVTDPGGLAGSSSITLEVKAVQTATFVSAGALDGFVLESGENTNAGGQVSSGQLRLGDNLADRQYRSLLSFDTSTLPDGALVRKVTVKAMRSGTTGVNPASTHGSLSADVKSGFFGASTALENADFADPATASGVALLTPAAANGGWTEGVFDAAGRAAISLNGTTQVRLQFSLDDDDDATNDYLDHYGGESTVASTRPQLVVEYLP